MEICSVKDCGEIPEYLCSCSDDIVFCRSHIGFDEYHSEHSIQSIYTTLDDESVERIANFINPIINKISKSIENSRNLAQCLISQIKKNFKDSYEKLKAQQNFLEEILMKCYRKKVKKNEMNFVWNSLNNYGVREMFNSIEFVDDARINPTYEYLKKMNAELSQPLSNEVILSNSLKFTEDMLFRECLQYLSQVNTLQAKLSCENSQKIIEKVRFFSINAQLPHRDHSDSRYENQSTLDSIVSSNDFTNYVPVEIDYQDLSRFFTKELVVKIIKTHKILTAHQVMQEKNDYNFQEINNINEILYQVDITGSLLTSEILNILQHKYELKDQCLIIKRFFFLGQGDFFNSIFAAILKTPQLYKEEITEILEGNCTKRINKKYLSKLTLNYDDYTDKYSLFYQFFYPLNVLFTESISADLHQIFEFLWEFKLIEYKIKNSFKQITYNYVERDEFILIHKFLLLKYRLIVLLNIVIFLIMEEIVEHNWRMFTKKLNTTLTLEEISVVVREMVLNIKLICVENSKNYRNFNEILVNLQEFYTISQKLAGEVYEYTTYLNDLNDISERISSAIEEIKLNYELLPIEGKMYFKTRIAELCT